MDDSANELLCFLVWPLQRQQWVEGGGVYFREGAMRTPHATVGASDHLPGALGHQYHTLSDKTAQGLVANVTMSDQKGQRSSSLTTRKPHRAVSDR